MLLAWWEPTPTLEDRTPRLSDLKHALRWLKAQYQKRAEEAASGRDRTIERIRKLKAKKDPS